VTGEVPAITPAELTMRIALGEVGVHEEPPGSNRGPRVDEYLRAAGLDPAGGSYPWCACFVTWCVMKAAKRLGVQLRFRGSASVATLLARNHELITRDPEPGAVFIHLRDDGKGHTGFVTGIVPGVGFTSIEGNTDKNGSRTGGQVMHQSRPHAYANAFFRIA
jgi:hypothetical protein